MFIVLFAIAVGGVMLWTKLKEYRENKQQLDLSLSNQKFERYSFYKPFLILYFVFVAIGLGSAIFGLYSNDFNTVALGLMIVLLFLGEILIAPLRYSLYYNNTTFLHQGTAVRYKSIKKFNHMKNIPFAFVKVVTTNGQTYAVSRKSYKIIFEKYNDIKNKK